MRSNPSSPPPPPDQLLLDLPGAVLLRLLDPRGRDGATDGPPPGGPAHKGAKTSAVETRVWLVWEDDDVLGVYTDGDAAAQDTAALRAVASRGRNGMTYECLPVLCFAYPRHLGPQTHAVVPDGVSPTGES